jgi:hypothetical protein
MSRRKGRRKKEEGKHKPDGAAAEHHLRMPMFILLSIRFLHHPLRKKQTIAVRLIHSIFVPFAISRRLPAVFLPFVPLVPFVYPPSTCLKNKEGRRNKEKRKKAEERKKNKKGIKGNKKRKPFFNLLISSSLVPVSLLLISTPPRWKPVRRMLRQSDKVPFPKMSYKRFSKDVLRRL